MTIAQEEIFGPVLVVIGYDTEDDAVHAIYDAWSPARAYPHTHGGVRILTESASARMASPVEVRFDEQQAGIGYDPRRQAWNLPAPWPGWSASSY